MLRLDWAETFLAVAESRSFQLAAARLRIAQPTVSQQLRKLEGRLGVPLVRRARAGCELTDAGRAFLPYAQTLLRVNGQALAEVAGNRVRVGAASNIGIYLLQPYIRSFLDSGTAPLFDLTIDRNPAIARALVDAEVNVAVMEWWQPRAGFVAQRWRSEPIVLIVPPGHALSARCAVGRAELSSMELLGGEPGTGTGRLLETYFAGTAPPRVTMQLGSTEAVKQAVMAGVGISLVLACAVKAEVAGGALRAIELREPPLTKDLYVIWRDGGRQCPPPPFAQHLLPATSD